MGAIYETAFERAIQNGGLRSIGSSRVGITKDGSGISSRFDFPTTSGGGSNPAAKNEKSWSRSGSRLEGAGTDWGTWTANGTQNLGALDIDIPDGAGGYTPLARIDGNDLPKSIGDAVEVTMTITSSNGTVDLVRPGLAEIFLRGASSTTPYYVLLDAQGSILASKQAGGWNFSTTSNLGGSDCEFTQGSDVVFDNSSGGSWEVDAIEVREGSNSGPAIMRDSVGATVQNGGSITFTDITLGIAGLT